MALGDVIRAALDHIELNGLPAQGKVFLLPDGAAIVYRDEEGETSLLTIAGEPTRLDARINEPKQ
jgi:hypothetical protein